MVRVIASLSLLLLSSAFASAQNGVLSFLDADVNARTAGMAGAGAVCRDNPMALYANGAAALAGDNAAGGAIFTGPWRTGYEFADVVCGGTAFYRPGGLNMVSAGFRYISGPSMDIMDEYGHLNGSMRPVDWALDLGYGRLFGKSWAVALNARWVRSDYGFGDGPSDVAMLDLHGAYLGRLASEERGSWTAGLSVKGMGTPLRAGGDSYALPLDVVAAGNVELAFGKSHSLAFSADMDFRVMPSAMYGISAGAEYTFLRHGVLRAGYCATFSKIAGMCNCFNGFASAGCGLVFGHFRCDAACRFCNDKSNPLHLSTVFSVSVLF